MLTNVSSKLKQSTYSYSNWAILEAHFTKQPYEVAIVGNDFNAKRKALDKQYLPDVLLMGGKTEGDLQLLESKLVEDQTTIYVCQNKSCKRPVTNVDEAFKQLN